MKSRTSHLIHLLVWLLVLTAYVVVLNGLPQAPGLLLTIPAGLGWDCRGPGVVGLSDHEETRGLSVPTISLFQYSLEANGLALEHPLCSPAGPCSFGETADRPGGVSDSAGRSASMAPVFFPVFLPAQGGRRCWAWVRF